MKLQKGFTLIELMVVIVIIGILSALAVPKMFGTSAKAKAAEAPTIISNWETLESAYAQEKGAAGDFTAIGFKDPGASSKWFTYDGPVSGGGTGAVMTASVRAGIDFGDCKSGNTFVSTFTTASDSTAHTSSGTCVNYAPNF